MTEVGRGLGELWELVATGDFIRAAGLGLRLLEQTSDPAELAHVEAALGLILQRMGRAVESRDRFDRAVALATTDWHRAAYLADSATSRVLSGDVAGAETAARRAMELAGSAHPAAAAEAANALALAAQCRGDVHRAFALSQQAVDLVLPGQNWPGGGPMAHLQLGMALVDLDRFDEADAAYTTGLGGAEAAGNLAQQAWYLGFRALERFIHGHWTEAVTDAAATIVVADRSGTVITRPLAVGVWALIEAFRGRQVQAQAALERVGVSHLGAFGGFGEESVLLAYAALAESPVGRLEALTRAWDLRRPRPYLIGWRSIAPHLVKAAVESGDRALAESVTEEALEGARLADGVGSAEGVALHCQALLADDAEQLDEAVAYIARTPRPFLRAHTCFDAGRLWLANGERQRGLARLREAAQVFQALGSTVWVTRTARLVASYAEIPLPRAPQEAEKTDWAKLTRTEREIARLAAVGLTNPAIASRMGVSSRTVQSHLAHVYTKLGIHSRIELSAQFASLASPGAPTSLG